MQSERSSTDADDLRRLWTAAGSHWREDHGLPLQGRLTLDRMTALVCIEHFSRAAFVRCHGSDGGRGRRCQSNSVLPARLVPTLT